MRWVESRHKWVIASDEGLCSRKVSSSDDPKWRYETLLFRTRKLARLECPKGCRVVKVVPYYIELVTEPSVISEQTEIK